MCPRGFHTLYCASVIGGRGSYLPPSPLAQTETECHPFCDALFEIRRITGDRSALLKALDQNRAGRLDSRSLALLIHRMTTSRSERYRVAKRMEIGSPYRPCRKDQEILASMRVYIICIFDRRGVKDRHPIITFSAASVSRYPGNRPFVSAVRSS